MEAFSLRAFDISSQLFYFPSPHEWNLPFLPFLCFDLTVGATMCNYPVEEDSKESLPPSQVTF